MRAPSIYGREQLGAQGKEGGMASVESKAARRSPTWIRVEGRRRRLTDGTQLTAAQGVGERNGVGAAAGPASGIGREERNWAALRNEGSCRRKGRVGPKEREEEEIFFFFFNFIFKSKFQPNLLFLSKPKHHKINMHQHECLNMYVDLIFSFNFNKVIIFLSLHAHKMHK